MHEMKQPAPLAPVLQLPVLGALEQNGVNNINALQISFAEKVPPTVGMTTVMGIDASDSNP